MTTRRLLLAGGAATLLSACAPPVIQHAAPALWTPPASVKAQLDAIEARVGGRLGICALDTATARRIMHRETERFAMCSSFKWMLVAAILKSVEDGFLRLDTFVRYTPADILPHSPVTQAHVSEGGLPLEALCAAAIEQSDNCAANLLLVAVNGPAGLTSFLSSHGDGVTRLDRNEVALNQNAQGDLRDTTTPDATIRTMQTLLLGDVLNAASREKLIGWMVAGQTGLDRLRAGLAGWRAGDKTGTGSRGAVNDVAIAYPPGRAALLIACYMSETTATTDACSAAQAQIARLIAEIFAYG